MQCYISPNLFWYLHRGWSEYILSFWVNLQLTYNLSTFNSLNSFNKLNRASDFTLQEEKLKIRPARESNPMFGFHSSSQWILFEHLYRLFLRMGMFFVWWTVVAVNIERWVNLTKPQAIFHLKINVIRISKIFSIVILFIIFISIKGTNIYTLWCICMD